MNFLTKILPLLLTLQVVYSRDLTENEEQRKIQEYIRYVESITNTMHSDVFAVTRRACEEIVNEVPVEARGELTAAFKKFVEDAVIAERSTDYNAQEELIDSLEVKLEDIFKRGKNPTAELMVVGSKLRPVAFDTKKIYDARTEKFITASKNLESLFSSNGISRNQKLFEKIRSFENNNDSGREQIFKDILAYKA